MIEDVEITIKFDEFPSREEVVEELRRMADEIEKYDPDECDGRENHPMR